MMEPQDDNGLFAQTGQDNQKPDGQTQGQLSDENGQIPSNEQTTDEDGDGLDVPSEDGMAEDDDLDDEDSDEETVPGDGLLQSGAV